jgi:hypothetical protein
MLSSISDLDEFTFNSQTERYTVTLIVILIMSSPRSHATIEGDIDLAIKQTSL